MSTLTALVFLGAALALNAQTITVSSGADVTFLKGPAYGSFGRVFSASDFSAASAGTPASVLIPNPLWIPSLVDDPKAEWIGTSQFAGTSQGDTALYAVSFQIAGTPNVGTLQLFYAEDDAIGDNLNDYRLKAGRIRDD